MPLFGAFCLRPPIITAGRRHCGRRATANPRGSARLYETRLPLVQTTRWVVFCLRTQTVTAGPRHCG